MFSDEEERKERKQKLQERRQSEQKHSLVNNNVPTKKKKPEKPSMVDDGLEWIRVPAPVDGSGTWHAGGDASSGMTTVSYSNQVSPLCTVTSTYHSPDQAAMDPYPVNIMEQAWRSAGDLTASEMNASKNLASFSTASYPNSSSIPSAPLNSLPHKRMSSAFSASSSAQPGNTLPPLSVFKEALDHSHDGKQAGSGRFPVKDVLPVLQSRSVTPEMPGSMSSGSSPQDNPGRPSLYPLSFMELSEGSKAYGLRVFKHTPREDLPSDPYMYWRLSEEERCLLTQLSAAYQVNLSSQSGRLWLLPTLSVSLCVCVSVCLSRFYGLYLGYYGLDFDQTWWECWNLGPIDCVKI